MCEHPSSKGTTAASSKAPSIEPGHSVHVAALTSLLPSSADLGANGSGLEAESPG